MLPSRLFRNVGLPPALRSLLTPKPSLPPTIQVQFHLRLGLLQRTLRSYSSALNSNNAAASEPSSSTQSTPLPAPSSGAASASSTTTSQPLPEKVEPRLSMTFTCTVQQCGERSTHEFTKRAYERGIVVVQCPGCKNRHLIADHLGWFKEGTDGGKLKTVEDILRAKGEKITRGRVNSNGDLEYVDEWNMQNTFTWLIGLFQVILVKVRSHDWLFPNNLWLRILWEFFGYDFFINEELFKLARLMHA